MNPKYKPDRAFFNHVVHEYARRKYGYPTAVVSNESREKMLIVAYGMTAWLMTKNGVKWLFSSLGVEELEPHFGFEYLYVASGERKRLSKDGKLRVFRKIDKMNLDTPKSCVDTAAKVIMAEGWKTPIDEVFEFVGQEYKAWLRSMTGYQWAAKNFKAISNVDNLAGICYRFETSDKSVYWFDSNQIEPEANPLQSCECCDGEFPCIDKYTGLGMMCNRCYSEHFADVEVLAGCQREECFQIDCHHYIHEKDLYEIQCNIRNFPVQWRGHG